LASYSYCVARLDRLLEGIHDPGQADDDSDEYPAVLLVLLGVGLGLEAADVICGTYWR
jgi:hypothetical protein